MIIHIDSKNGIIYYNGEKIIEFKYSIFNSIIVSYKGIALLLDYDKYPNDINIDLMAGRNILFIDFEGNILWQIRQTFSVSLEQINIKTPYIGIGYERYDNKDYIGAYNPSGWEVLIDIDSGEVINEKFVK